MEKQIDKNKGRDLAMKYTLLQGLFWTSFAVIWGFVAVYLQYKSFSNTQIGTITSTGTIISIILQPILASISEKRRNIKPKSIAAGISILLTVCTALLMISSSKMIIVATVYALIGGLSISLPSLLNTIGLAYMNQGVPINYGFSRGIGSICYALMALGLGNVIENTSPDIILPIFLVLVGFMSFLFLSLKNEVTKDADAYSSAALPKETPNKGFLYFMFRYKKFMVLMLGIIFLFAGHNIINTYMINIMKNIGGNSSHLGFAVGLAALVELPTMLMFSKIAQKINVGKLLRISSLFFVLKAFMISLAPGVTVVLLSQLLQIGGFALFTPASVYYVNQVIGYEHHSTGQSVLGVATMGIGGAMGNILGGKLLDIGGTDFMLKWAVIISAGGFVITMLTTEDISFLE